MAAPVTCIRWSNKFLSLDVIFLWVVFSCVPWAVVLSVIRLVYDLEEFWL